MQTIKEELWAFETKWKLAPGFRLQWENSQQSMVLLYPEGMIVLNSTAGEILSLCCDDHSYGEILARIKSEYESEHEEENQQNGEFLERDLRQFLREAQNHGWLRVQNCSPP